MNDLKSKAHKYLAEVQGVNFRVDEIFLRQSSFQVLFGIQIFQLASQISLIHQIDRSHQCTYLLSLTSSDIPLFFV